MASWTGPDVAAVLFIGTDEETYDSTLEYSIELLWREDEAWSVESRGGNDWIADDLWVRPPDGEVWLSRGDHTLPAGGGYRWMFRCGLVGDRVERLRFRTPASDYEHDLNGWVGAWVAGVLVPSGGGSSGAVEALGERGEVLSRVELSLSSWP